ncbi:hypothetical protein XELAEV_18036600mg [Xenopus laevis]|uniref:Uncharacterized protein n=1 Tax=Xenopus laevis TaxID=8355 RepID=A0A974H9V2_XENLA|nr:hypothetical protein XELAEV_18036600mg [Xenopus laevis]
MRLMTLSRKKTRQWIKNSKAESGEWNVPVEKVQDIMAAAAAAGETLRAGRGWGGGRYILCGEGEDPPKSLNQTHYKWISLINSPIQHCLTGLGLYTNWLVHPPPLT